MGKVLQLYNGEAEKLYGRRDGVRVSWIARHSMPMPVKRVIEYGYYRAGLEALKP